jgi:hypothetical protein
MKEMVDRLSRDLASGISRRKALWMFIAGSGVVGAFAGQKASAESLPSKILCAESCARQAEAFMQLCIEASAGCPNGYCAEFTMLPIKVNGTNIIVNTTHLSVNGTYVYTFDETSTPVHF